MRAAVMREFGNVEVLSVEDVPDPRPGPGHVRLAVDRCALNHVDVDIREGTSRFDIGFPHIPGLEVVGRIDALGEGVSDFALGERVMPYLLGGEVFMGVAGPGGLADHAVVPTGSSCACPTPSRTMTRPLSRWPSARPGTCSSRAVACVSARRC